MKPKVNGVMLDETDIPIKNFIRNLENLYHTCTVSE